MANINISELAGAELFQDSESFLSELSEREMSIMGGDVSIISNNNTAGDIYSNGNTANANTSGNNNSVFRGRRRK